jgi:23S rRNA (uracil1939-C5)-methyltransferase
VLEAGTDQIDAPCPYFGVCGGCQLQHLKYESQVEAKTNQIREMFRRLGNFDDCEISPTLPADVLYGYRNKMEFTFSPQRWMISDVEDGKPKDFALGLHVPGRFDKVLDIDGCLLQSEISNGLMRNLKDLILQTGLPAYHPRSHQGFWRFLVLRDGKFTSDLMMNIITSSQVEDEGKPVFDWLMHKLFWKNLELTAALHGTSDKKAQVAFADSERVILGDGKLREQIGHCRFEISPNAFFQTNSYQTKVLFDTIAELAELSSSEVVWDLYCGTGAIGIYLANRVKQVVGIEVIWSAVKDGKRNVKLNNLDNVKLFEGDMMSVLRDPDFPLHKFDKPDAVILDPPRAGTHPKTIQDILTLLPPKIIYVSCNPPMLVKDLEMLREQYTIRAVQPVDMFPHTKHVEVVCILHKKS